MNFELLLGMALTIFCFHSLESFGPKTMERIVWSIVGMVVGCVITLAGCMKLIGGHHG